MPGLDRYRYEIDDILWGLRNLDVTMSNGMISSRALSDLVDQAVDLLNQMRRDGWHYCTEWDDLLICPDDEEYATCPCLTDYEGE